LCPYSGTYPNGVLLPTNSINSSKCLPEAGDRLVKPRPVIGHYLTAMRMKRMGNGGDPIRKNLREETHIDRVNLLSVTQEKDLTAKFGKIRF